ncbi:Acriflavin resistance a [Moritella viscosa]|uniref:Acriflavin resistance a n=1 Tax=Moritella viscosa TaxID=80854 RepID=A0A1L0CA99_9GAMM|nr:Acriflavin resistance a [Moritella viscosa]SHO15354.1 Acriflavin resistance a [Moritella viscosa]SHO18053.1 Acriflavin resistance a [Moritella viscosa]
MPIPTYCRVYHCKNCGHKQRLFHQSDVVMPQRCYVCGGKDMNISAESPSLKNEIQRVIQLISHIIKKQ